jgi:hypothetical protein
MLKLHHSKASNQKLCVTTTRSSRLGITITPFKVNSYTRNGTFYETIAKAEKVVRKISKIGFEFCYYPRLLNQKDFMMSKLLSLLCTHQIDKNEYFFFVE